MPNAKYYFFLVLLRVMNPQFFGTSGYSLSSPSPLPITERIRRLQMHHDHVPHPHQIQHLHVFIIITFTKKVAHRCGLGFLPDLPVEERVEKFNKTPKSSQNSSWHLYYMLKMRVVNRSRGGPIPFSLLEILLAYPQALPMQPSPESGF